MGDNLIILTETDLKKVVLGLNVLSSLLFNMTGAEEIKNLDGDPVPGWYGHWQKICNEAHLALGRASYAKGES